LGLVTRFLPAPQPDGRIVLAARQFIHAGVRGRQGSTRDTVVMTAQQQFGLVGPIRGRWHDRPDHRPGHAAAGPVIGTGRRSLVSGYAGGRGRFGGLAGR
jgi:hypothetical protein